VAFLAFDWSPADNTMNIKDLMTLDASRMRNIVDLDRAGIHQRRHQTMQVCAITTSCVGLAENCRLVTRPDTDGRLEVVLWSSCCQTQALSRNLHGHSGTDDR
tara:strand:+ start:963 stop:1271 length:309 start_codon:yes stop_codon:yes gene_type:complete